MYFSDEIELLEETISPTAAGQPDAAALPGRTVWANRKQATASEYYKAAAVGKKLTAVFEVHTEDYAGETLVRYAGRLYDVERSYQTKPSLVELSCTDARRNKEEGPVA